MPPPTVPLQLVNKTGGAYRDDQIYITITGQFPVTSDKAGKFAWVDSTGQIRAIADADRNAPNHLTKDGVNYANYSFTLQQASQLTIPPLIGGRVYVSLGVPIYPIVDAGNNYTVPSAVTTTNNPNYLTHFDHYEETFDPTSSIFTVPTSP
jgi:hypothetical protein